MKVFTCTPVPFEGDDRFFTRESGCFSRGLSSLGVESLPIMPEPAWKTDSNNLLRVPYSRLEDPEFWRSLRLDGLILYSWAAPKYLPIARATRAAGIPFLVNVDFCGLVSRVANPYLWWRDLLPYQLRKTRSLVDAARFSKQFLEGLGFGASTRKRLQTYTQATAICAVSPMAALWLKNETSRLRRPDLTSKIQYLPHPQMDIFSYDGAPKEKVVLSVGRWEMEDWTQKHPANLLHALDMFLEKYPDWRALIVGTGATKLISRLGTAKYHNIKRIEFIDFIKTEKLMPLLNKASICCWASRSEGQIGAGAQALCCGCSVVAGNSGTLSCFYHYASRESGRLATDMTASGLAEALMLEAQAWDSKQRDPARISRIWKDEFHSSMVAKRALHMLNLSVPSMS
jgi:glycosyltransferase involved in cell wall biosynthesis